MSKMQMQCRIFEDCDFITFKWEPYSILTALSYHFAICKLFPEKDRYEKPRKMWTLSALELICLHFFFFFCSWVQISKFSFKNFRQLVWGGRRNLMRLLAWFQPLYHQPPILGVSPLARGEKAKVQFKPKKEIVEKKENAQHAKRWRNINQSVQPAIC